MYRCYSLVGEGEADSEAVAEGDGDGSPDENDGAGTEGSGTGVGSGMKRDGMPAIDRTMISTKIPMTVMIHGRASRSSRGGRAPR